MIGSLRALATSLIHRSPSTLPPYYTSLFPTSTSIQAFSWPTLALETVEPISNHRPNFFPPLFDGLMEYLWLAVPKRKVTPGKKRMKTTLQNRIQTKSHVIVDRRTGELTLRHRLPWNWKDYLPENLQGKKDQKDEE